MGMKREMKKKKRIPLSKIVENLKDIDVKILEELDCHITRFKIKDMSDYYWRIGQKKDPTEVVEELMKKYPVWMSDIKTLDDACDMIKKVGLIVSKEQKAEEMELDVFDCLSANHINDYIESRYPALRHDLEVEYRMSRFR